MKKIAGLLILLLIAGVTYGQNLTKCTDWRVSEIYKLTLPFFAEQKSVDGKIFDSAALLENVQSDFTGLKNWSITTTSDGSVISKVNCENQMILLGGFIRSDRWAKATINVVTNGIFELSVDGRKVKSQTKASDKPVKIDLNLGTGVHEVSIKLISIEKNLSFSADVASQNESAVLSWSTNPERTVTINDILEVKAISGARLSPSGKYLLLQTSEVLPEKGKPASSFTIYDLEVNRNLFSLQNNALRAEWMPQSDRLFYVVEKEGRSDVILFDMKTGKESIAASGFKSPGSIVWSPNEDYFIFSRTVEAEKTGDLKRVFSNEDRIPGNRNRSYLSIYDIRTKLSRPLTAGARSAMLHDISPDGGRILFSTSQNDYSEAPFSKQALYELQISTMRLDTIWKDKLYSGSCQYSPDGSQLLVSGAPEAFGSIGVKVSEGRIPNSYDTQLYLFDLKTKRIESLTRDFDPSVSRVYWAKDGKVYMTVVERDYVNLYRLDMKKRSFTKIDVPVEIITSIDYAANKNIAVLSGNSINTPGRLYTLDLSTAKSTMLLDPAKERMEDVSLGKTEEWNFKNPAGTTIYGRVYYPVNYDPAKKYPVIVNFYGGTTPVDRAFGGRYPKNVWAAEGYMVYVLQPGGAIGFGQDFSALHVNGWGREAIDDIIEGTKKFLAAFPSADADNVGCIGASYGGFTSMLIQTRTDIFKTAIAHAGISDITSYWGEGYWGYSYSTIAAKWSYPWNRRDIYVDNSPLFNADKFSNSILLLHGTSDTNVPVGESLQLYAALKILGKDVEMVLVNGEDHHILDYKKRIEWHNTIMSWFDMKLKNQPQHWNEMYPDKNL